MSIHLGMNQLSSDLVEQGFELRQTHISQVFLGDDRVFKVKKPVALGFLDFTTLEARKQACDAEVVLNRRLAPDVYRRVVPITRDALIGHRIGGAGEPVEWAVEMRRLPDQQAADQLLARGLLDRSVVQSLAEQLARFHAAARQDAETKAFGEPQVIEGNVRENFEQTRESALRYVDRQALQRIESWQMTFLRDQRSRLLQRIVQGRIRDGHGDLRLEHCYIDEQGAVRIIDCIEFNDRFRYGDVCGDLAFLSMDLLWHERFDLSEALLAAYARASQDYDLYGVVDFYESYRAYVRAKVSGMLNSDPNLPSDARATKAADARKYYVLAEACSREALLKPLVCVVFGSIGSGKSTFAEALASRIHAPVLDADRTRKFLAGVSQETPLPDAAFEGHYDAKSSDETYAELLRRAEVVLSSGRSVILDASFRERSKREAVMKLAYRHDTSCYFFECSAPREVCRQRILARAEQPSVSDGRAEILDAFVDSFEAPSELPRAAHIRVDTTRSTKHIVDAFVSSEPESRS